MELTFDNLYVRVYRRRHTELADQSIYATFHEAIPSVEHIDNASTVCVITLAEFIDEMTDAAWQRGIDAERQCNY